jgi:hypothetical protein
MIFISMTNEELIEELYHKAHAKGFFHELHNKVGEIKKSGIRECEHRLVQRAYSELKKIKLALPTPQI